MALVNKISTKNWSAISAVNISGGQGDPVMYMNASYNGKDFNCSYSIQNTELYAQHMTECDADYAEFEREVKAEVYGDTQGE